jgi:gluconolactonase
MRKHFIVFLFIIAVAVSSVAQTPDKSPLIRVDPSFDDIVSPDAKLEKIAGNLGHIEGPTWIQKGQFLILSDIANNVVDKWDPKDGKISTYLEGLDEGFPVNSNSMLGGPNGITLDFQGRIVIGTRSAHQVVRIEKDGKRTVLVSKYEGKNLNGINDLVYKSDGSLYFTDPTWGVAERKEKNLPPPTWDLDFPGVYLFKDGKLTPVVKDMKIPNGVAFTPDEKYLYVNDTGKRTILKFEVKPDDTLGDRQLFIDMSSDKAVGNPDGMKIDVKGNVYCTGPGGVWVMSPDGKHLGTFLIPEQTSNFGFGDPDGKSIYFAARTGLYRIHVKIPGIFAGTKGK